MFFDEINIDLAETLKQLLYFMQLSKYVRNYQNHFADPLVPKAIRHAQNVTYV